MKDRQILFKLELVGSTDKINEKIRLQLIKEKRFITVGKQSNYYKKDIKTKVVVSLKKSQDLRKISKWKEKKLKNLFVILSNLDESTFSYDFSKTKIVRSKKLPAVRTVSSSGRENTIDLLAVQGKTS